MKNNSYYYCKVCGTQSTQWMGKCPSCNSWNTFEQEVVLREEKKRGSSTVAARKSTPKPLSEISTVDLPRVASGSTEFDNVLGGGIVPGSITLLGGEPGIGKSTLLLQIALRLKSKKILYISGEESENQLKMRAQRLDNGDNAHCFILTETNTQEAFAQVKEVNPDIIIVDSIQTMQSSLIDSGAGSISQIKECSAEFQHLAKSTGTPVFLIGHITKEGSIAGPKILEHIVDTVLQFEGDMHYGYRIVRCIKNRFGSTSELGIFEMCQAGLREVTNPSEILISERDEVYSGTAIASIMEGNRPLMIETQALVSSAVYGTPQRAATGFDIRRLNMLLAVLEKRCGFKIGAKDVFINIAGGFRIEDPAINLAVVAAIMSSGIDVAINPKDCFVGELGLSGEVRSVARIEQRIAEANKLGFKRIFFSKYNLKGLSNRYEIELCPIGKIEELIPKLFQE